MTRLLLFFLFYVVGVASLMVFNILVLELGDPKFSKDIKIALGFYFPVWLALFTPHMLIGSLIFTLKTSLSQSHCMALLIFTILIMFLVEVSFVLDAKLLVIALEFVVILLAAWFIRQWLMGRVL